MSGNTVSVTYDDANGNGVAVTAATPMPVTNAGSGATAQQVQGNIASAATDSGNPVKVGGKYNSTRPTFTDGQRGDLQIDARGNLATLMTAAQTTAADAFGNTLTGFVRDTTNGANLLLMTGTYLYNETSHDQLRSNVNTAALITAAGATSTQNSSDQTNYNGRGVKVVLDMTSVGTGSVTITIQGKDAASGKYYTLLAGAAVTTNSTNVYEVYPGVTVAANASASTVLPRTWRVLVTANNANATTYTVGASVIL